MDTDCDGYLTMDNLREFLANNGFFATERELQGIIQKCDKDGDSRISFNEFVDEFQPKLGFWINKYNAENRFMTFRLSYDLITKL